MERGHTVFPIMYSFRRCPYCIRANMALRYSGVEFTLRDVELRDLPADVLRVSPNATVPSLVLGEAAFIDESWDIVKWALKKNDPDNWLGQDKEYLSATERLVAINDSSFKENLDHYKYAVRFPEHPAAYYRARCEPFLSELNTLLDQHVFLLSDSESVADVAIFPFIRQFSFVDKSWFDHSPYTGVQRWLEIMLKSPWFLAAFKKRDIWKPTAEK